MKYQHNITPSFQIKTNNSAINKQTQLQETNFLLFFILRGDRNIHCICIEKDFYETLSILSIVSPPASTGQTRTKKLKYIWLDLNLQKNHWVRYFIKPPCWLTEYLQHFFGNHCKGWKDDMEMGACTTSALLSRPHWLSSVNLLKLKGFNHICKFQRRLTRLRNNLQLDLGLHE